MAQISSPPEIRVKEATREAALHGVERRLRAYLDRVEPVRLARFFILIYTFK